MKFSIIFAQIILSRLYKMNKLLLTGFIFLAFACAKNDNIIQIGDYVEGQAKGSCKVASNTRINGSRIGFSYKDGKLEGLTGFPDFDTFEYNGSLISAASNSRDKSYKVNFTYNDNNQISEIIFDGRDSQGRLFKHTSLLVYNKDNRIQELILDLPVFEDKLSTFLEYDNNGNVKKISAKVYGELQPLLENISFDDKRSPYLNQKIGPILTYFMIYALVQGGENLSYYLNQNNVTQSTVYSNNEKIEFGYQYEYNANGYPIKTDISQNKNNRLKSLNEYFDYLCE